MGGRASVLQILYDMGYQVSTMSKDAARFNRYQTILESELSMFEDVEDLKVSFSMILKLWEGLDSWEKSKEAWAPSTYRVEEIQLIQSQNMPRFLKTCLQASKCMPGNNVVQLWRSDILRVKDALTVIVALLNQALKPEHWEMIRSLSSPTQISSEQDLTLGSVLACNLDSHVNKILEISSMATDDSTPETRP